MTSTEHSSPGHDDGIDVAKGLMIAAIVVGHTAVVSSHVEGLNAFLYRFHVQAFLLLPFLLPFRTEGWGRFLGKLPRYIVPFVAFSLFGFMLKVVRSAASGVDAPNGALLVHGLLTGSAQSLDAATDLLSLWFMPSLVALLLLRRVASSSTRAWWAVALAGFLFHLLAGRWPEALAHWTPFGFAASLACYPMGLIVTGLLAPWLSKNSFPIGVQTAVATAVLVIVSQWSDQHGVKIQLATLGLPTVLFPTRLLAADVAMLAGFTCFVGYGRILRQSAWLRELGSHSMCVYFIHQYVIQAMTKAFEVSKRVVTRGPSELSGWEATLVAGLAIACSLVIAKRFTTSRLGSAVFPKNWQDVRDWWADPARQGTSR